MLKEAASSGKQAAQHNQDFSIPYTADVAQFVVQCTNLDALLQPWRIDLPSTSLADSGADACLYSISAWLTRAALVKLCCATSAQVPGPNPATGGHQLQGCHEGRPEDSNDIGLCQSRLS
jgi:hypothetical protein